MSTLSVPIGDRASHTSAEGKEDIQEKTTGEESNTVVNADEDDWDHDPRHPYNWPPRAKWTMVAIVSLYTVVGQLASAIMAPALPAIAAHFAIGSGTVLGMALSIYLLALALGPLVLAPLSELYGRTWVLHIGMLTAVAFNLGCAFAPNTGTLIGMRFLAGISGSVGLAIGGGTIGDLFAPRERALAMGLYGLGPTVGPAVGPIAGGFMTGAVGWKWIFVLVAGVCALSAAVGVPLLRETYAPVIRERLVRAGARREEGGGGRREGREGWAYVWTAMTRPFLLLTTNLVCFVLSLYLAVLYGTYFLMFTSFPDLFATVYRFSTGVTGLCYVGISLGFLLATFLGVHIANVTYAQLSEKNGGQGQPEFRMPGVLLGALFVPIGLFWYGWSAQAGVHWIMPIIGTAIYGFGQMLAYTAIYIYLIDAFAFAASAVAASSVLRSLLGFAFPLFGAQMFAALGYGGGNSLLAGVSVVLGIPFPVVLWVWGPGMRARSVGCRC